MDISRRAMLKGLNHDTQTVLLEGLLELSGVRSGLGLLGVEPDLIPEHEQHWLERLADHLAEVR